MRNPAGERLGNDDLARLLPRPAGKTATDWLAEIIKKATAYADSVPFPDDIAAVAAVYET
jgi:hypothetical protein